MTGRAPSAFRSPRARISTTPSRTAPGGHAPPFALRGFSLIGAGYAQGMVISASLSSSCSPGHAGDALRALHGEASAGHTDVGMVVREALRGALPAGRRERIAPGRQWRR